ncbi:MAG TPA: putative transporter [Phycisphaerae bacterium]|nr:putative transporter [Phycisphaerae bacterium]
MNSFASLFYSLFPPQSMALTCVVLAIVATTGMALGSIKVKGISLGIPGVMFTGLIFGRLIGISRLSLQVIFFIRDFGLILFVYAVGVQVGPGFVASLRKRGLPLNLMAAAIILLGAATAVGIAYSTGTDMKAAVGLFAGGTTNAPAFGSAEEALKSIHPSTMPGTGTPSPGSIEAANITLPAFAIAYPFGLVGVIVAMVVFRFLFRVNPQADADAIAASEKGKASNLATMNIEVANPNLDGLPLRDIPALDKSTVVVSRLHHRGAMKIPTPETTIHTGDVLLAVGEPEEVHEFQLILGKPSAMDLRALPSNITTRQILVTRRDVLGKTVDELNLPSKLGVAVTRISRAGLEFTAVGDLALQFGDRIRAVGESSALDAAAKLLGDSARELNLPRLLPIFVGILFGVTLGCIPILPTSITNLPAPVKLGLASGPMLVAIILSRIGRVGPLIWYMPQSASGLLRELGIVLFLIAVGINGGDGFFNKLATPEGFYWLAYGAIITLLPLLLVGLFARIFLKTHYLHICGLLCGSMTSPSLAFTHTMTTSEAPAVAFATVYPLSMIMRVLVAQLMVLIFVK